MPGLQLPPTIFWQDGALNILDQRRLPARLSYVACSRLSQVERAIKNMTLRGAPLIGVGAAFGLALGARSIKTADPGKFRSELNRLGLRLKKARPTAVNLAWAIDRLLARAQDPGLGVDDLKQLLLTESQAVLREDQEQNLSIGRHGLSLLPAEKIRILTHCNAGHLATAGYGTALSVVYAATQAGRAVEVIADETRPLCQGARLTAWELTQAGVPVKVAVDGSAGVLMAKKMVDMVLVGADRITANGDVANKIGTFNLALQARHHGLPFYVAAPWSTIDAAISYGREVPIEERASREVTHLGAKRLCPPGVEAYNFAFDVTPHELVSAIITDRGVLKPPYNLS